MNERIKELVSRVGTDTSGKWISVDKVEELTELIKDECLKQCLGKETAKDAFYAIKKHFGDGSTKSWR